LIFFAIIEFSDEIGEINKSLIIIPILLTKKTGHIAKD